MLYDYDLIIVGASPAGYMAALSSTQDNKDLKVAIFDKKKSVDDNIHPSNSFYSGMFSILNENVDKSYILHEIDGMKLISPSGNKLTLNNKGWAIDKKKFDNFYYSKSVKSNISIFFECEIVDIQINKEFVLINVKTNTIYEKYTSKLIIIADGINSSSSKILGINTVKYPEDIAWGIEANIKYDQIGTSKYAEYYFGSHAPGWKSTYLPMSSDNASIGIYIRRNRKNLEKYFYKWLLRFANIKNINPKDIEIKSLK